jgi:transcription initiation factor TFIID TATA-box-binding protein
MSFYMETNHFFFINHSKRSSSEVFFSIHSMLEESVSGFQNVDIEIVNVVASVDIHQPLDLPSIVKKVKNAEYSPKRFPGIVYRTFNPKSAILLFRTGKMVCTGTKSREQAHEAVRKAIRELNAQGVEIFTEPEITIQNVVASIDFHKRIDILEMFDTVDNTMYEPEMFPGLIYRMKKPKAVLLLFSSGRVVCAGSRSKAMVYDAVEKMYNLVTKRGLLYK